jgi:hypothetical protein
MHGAWHLTVAEPRYDYDRDHVKGTDNPASAHHDDQFDKGAIDAFP